MSNRKQFLATVLENRPICREHFRLVLTLPEFPQTEPGQFIQIACRDLDFDAGHQNHDQSRLGGGAFLRRPFSLAGRHIGPGGSVRLEIIHRVVGIGTRWLSNLRSGDRVNVLGPLGNCFTLPSAGQMAILVGGGVGIPPMLYLAASLQGTPAVAFCGATTKDLLALQMTADADPKGRSASPCLAEFALHNVPSIVSTDDGSYGFRGFVTQALEQWLEEWQGQGARDKGQEKGTHSPLAPRPSPLCIYTCGPEPMMKRVADIAIARNIPCQVAVERTMACGMGTCQSCCIRVKKPDPKQPPLAGKDWCWRLTCTDGPVFDAVDLLW